MRNSILVESPIGAILVCEEDGAIVSVSQASPAFTPSGRASLLLRRAERELRRYFAGKRRDFDLPLRPGGSRFDRSVWKTMVRIPFGSTMTYGDVALALDTSPRAVGGACARNPIPIFIPCHRILGAGGALGGYTWCDGIATKRFLLKLEGVELPGPIAARGRGARALRSA